MNDIDEYDELTPQQVTERRVLGSAIRYPDAARDEFMLLRAECWSHWRHADLANIIRAMFEADEHVNQFSVDRRAINLKLVPSRIPNGYVYGSYEIGATGGELPALVADLLNAADAREVAMATEHALQRVNTLDNSDPADLQAAITDLRAALDRIEDRRADSGKTDKAVTFAELSDEFREHLDATEDEKRVIATPWPHLDEVLAGGLHPKRSYLFAGRPGDGKSLSLTNIAAYAAERGYAGLLFSVEMDRLEIMARMVSERTRSEYGPITRRELDTKTRGRIEDYMDANRGMRFAVVDKAPITVAEIRDHARRMQRTVGLDFLCVDYMQLVSSTNSKLTRERQIAEISVGLRTIAKQLDIPVISAAQLNRDSVKDNRAPTKADLRDSGSLENDADVIVLLHHLKNGDGTPNGLVEFIVDKNRTGKRSTITLEWKGYQARIANPESWRSVA